MNSRVPLVVGACLAAAALLGYTSGRLVPISASGAATAQQAQEARQTQQPPVNPATRPLPDFSSLVDQYGLKTLPHYRTSEISGAARGQQYCHSIYDNLVHARDRTGASADSPGRTLYR